MVHFCNRCGTYLAHDDTGLCNLCESQLYGYSLACIHAPVRLDGSVRQQAARCPLRLPGWLEPTTEDTQDMPALDSAGLERLDGDQTD